MSTRPRRALSPAEQSVRWGGLGTVLLAVVVAVAKVPGTQPLVPVLLLVGIGCYIAMAVLAYGRRQRGYEPGSGTGSDDSRNIETPR